MEQNITSDSLVLQVDNGNVPYLAEAAKWAKFLAVLGFIVCGLIVVVALAASSFMSTILTQFESQSSIGGLGSISGTILIVYYLLIALLYFIPCLFLFNFASKMQTAIKNNDQVYLNNSFKNLKSLFKFWGILTVIGLCIFVIAIIFAIIASTAFTH